VVPAAGRPNRPRRYKRNDGLRLERLGDDKAGLEIGFVFELVREQEMLAQGKFVIEQLVIGVHGQSKRLNSDFLTMPRAS